MKAHLPKIVAIFIVVFIIFMIWHTFSIGV